MYLNVVGTAGLLFFSSTGPIESTMYLSSSFVMCLSSIGDSVMHTSQTAHHTNAAKPAYKILGKQFIQIGS